jgi:HK97 gp10 family phage protein
MFSAKLDGLDGLTNRFAKLEKVLQDDISDEMSASVLTMQREAKRMAPKNLGKLAQSIQTDISAKFSKNMTANVSYAPYIEFGTGGQVSIPPGWESEAAAARGKGGTFKDMLLAIKDWCIRKGIDSKAAYPIALSILRKGIRPQPFFVPAYEAERPKLLQRIKNLLK